MCDIWEKWVVSVEKEDTLKRPTFPSGEQPTNRTAERRGNAQRGDDHNRAAEWTEDHPGEDDEEERREDRQQLSREKGGLS